MVSSLLMMRPAILQPGGEKDADFAAALHGMHSLGPIANERVANLEDPMLVGGTQAELRKRVARSVARQDVSHLQAHQGGWIRTKSCMAMCMADWVEVLQKEMQGYKILATLELDVGNSL